MKLTFITVIAIFIVLSVNAQTEQKPEQRKNIPVNQQPYMMKTDTATLTDTVSMNRNRRNLPDSNIISPTFRYEKSEQQQRRQTNYKAGEDVTSPFMRVRVKSESESESETKTK